MRRSYNVVGQINHLANPNYEGVIKALFLLKNIYNLEDEPNDAKAYKEERHNARGQCICSNTKHNDGPVPVLSNH
jgi:hypothetical protein